MTAERGTAIITIFDVVAFAVSVVAIVAAVDIVAVGIYR